MEFVESYIEKYNRLNLDRIVDYNKFNEFAITAHSTQIEGSTLTEEETSMLLDEGITPKGKPLEHSNMVNDHHTALELVKSLANSELPFSVDMICRINAAVMKNTGSVYETALGRVDGANGELRKGADQKVPGLMLNSCQKINDRLKEKLTRREKIDLCYAAHYNHVTIHPHYDGNGRTARLLMNYLQLRFSLPMSVVYREDKLDYLQALEKSREKDDIGFFYEFMDGQYIKYLSKEMTHYKDRNKGNEMTLMF